MKNRSPKSPITMTQNTLVGPDGKPLGEMCDEKHLPLEIQMFIETQLNKEIARAVETVRNELREDRRDRNVKGWIRYGVLMFANVAVGLLFWIYGRSEVEDLTKKYVAENMNKPTLEAAAKEVISNKMDNFVSGKLVPLARQVATTESQVDAAKKTLSRLQEEQRLIAMMNRAEAYDKQAFIDLIKFASGEDETAKVARGMVSKVQRSFMLDEVSQLYVIPGKAQFGGVTYEVPTTSEELARRLESETSEGAVNLVADRKALLFVPKLVEMARTSNDLWLLHRISFALKRMVGVEYAPWEVAALEGWWSQNKSSYTNWPFKAWKDGLWAFNACKYRDALAALESVLAVDPSADRARATAVAAAAEVGNLTKAKELNKDFAEKGGPWEEWAGAKMLLATGAVEQASKQLSSLVTRWPVMKKLGCVAEGSDVFRNLDWAEFSKLSTNSTASVKENASITNR